MAFIARDRPGVAGAWFDGLVERIDLLRTLPDQGRVVPEWHEATVREILYSPYRVIYEVSGDVLEILILSHERQKLGSEGAEDSL